MLNQIVLVGRMVRDIKPNKTEKGNVATLTIAIPRSFKNVDGTYDTDFVDCVLFNQTACNTAEYCHKGDIIGIKGRVQTREIEENGNKKNIMEIIADKITFLSNKKETVNEDEKIAEESEELDG